MRLSLENYKAKDQIVNLIILGVFLIFISSCSHFNKVEANLSKWDTNLSRSLVFNLDENYELDYFHQSFTDKTLNKKRQVKKEELGFTIKFYDSKFVEKYSVYDFKVKTINKTESKVNIEDLGFPELNKVFKYRWNTKAQIIEVNDFPKHSFYYIPYVVLPESDVKKGESWDFSHMWKSDHNDVVLELKLKSTLVDYYNCFEKKCALISIDGNVIPKNYKIPNFKANLKGYFFIITSSAQILWSEVHSREEVDISGEKVLMKSCLASKSRGKYELKLSNKCDINKGLPQKVEGLF